MHEQILDALRRGAVDQALDLARSWSAQAPDDAAAQRALANALAQTGDSAAALAALDRAILLDPEDAGLHFERAALLVHARDPAAARAALGQSLALDPNHLPAYLAQAQLALARGDVAESERLLRTAARIDPDHPRLAVAEAQLALRRGDADRAMALASQAATQLPDDPQLLSVLGFAYLAKRHLAFAEQTFRRVLDLLPDAPALRPMLAQLAAAQGRLDDAAAMVEPLLADPATDTPPVRRMAGMLALQAGNAEQAVAHLRRVLAVRPDDRDVLQGLLSAWSARGDREDARATLEAALATHAAGGELWAARLAVETPGTSERAEVLERWLAAMPSHPPALEAGMIQRDRAGDLAGTTAFAQRLVAADPAHPFAAQFLVEARLASEPDAALAQAAQMAADAQGQDRLAVQAWHGQLLDRAGRPGEALALWQSLHAGGAAGRVPLPALAPAPQAWPPLAATADGDTHPVLVWGAPGSGIDRVVDTLAAAGGPVLRDRFATPAPTDALQSPVAAAALADGRLSPQALVAQWRAALPGRGIASGNVVDWLPWWDNTLLLALRPHLPEGLLLSAVRDPRDMLLDWLASGAPVPLRIESLEAAADWLAAALEQLADLHEQDLYPHVLLRLDGALESPPALAAAVGEALGVQLPPPPPAPRRLPPGRWRAYQQVMAAPFARLAPVAVRLGYPET